MTSPALPGSAAPRWWVCALLFAALAAAPACKAAPSPEGRRSEQAVAEARAVVQQARQLADAGDLAGAIDLLESELSGRGDKATLLFTLGWYYDRLAETRGGPAKTAALESARNSYRRVVALIPDNAQARTNLALVLRKLGALDEALAEIERIDPPTYSGLILLGDIQSERGDLEAALAVYDRAYRMGVTDAKDKWDELAPTRIVFLLRAQLATAAGRPQLLLEYIAEFEAADLLQPASWGYEALMRDCGAEAAAALNNWVRLEARRDTLSFTSIRRLLESDACPALEDALLELDGLLLELTEPSSDPRQAAEDATARLEYWLQPLDRRYTVSRAMQSLARTEALEERRQNAVAIYEEAIFQVAPEGVHYDEGRPLHGQADVALDMTLDLVLLLNNFRSELDPDRDRLRQLLRRQPALASFSEESLETLDRTPEEVQRVHTVLGFVYAELEDGWKGPAQYHFEQAIVVAGEIQAEKEGRSNEHPLPFISRAIGDGLSESGDPGGTLDAFLDAARGYIEDDRRTKARELYSPGRDVAARARKKFFELEETLYPPYGWYLGANLGNSDIDGSAGELDRALTGLGSDVDVTFDSDDNGWKVYGGYRFRLPLAVELGYTSFGGPTSSVRENGGPNSTLLGDVRDEHPRAGQGVTLALVAIPLQWERLSTNVKGGGWFWNSELDVNVETVMGTFNVRDEEEGFDFFYGLGLQYKLGKRTSVRAEYEIYRIDTGDASNDIDLLSIGLVYKL